MRSDAELWYARRTSQAGDWPVAALRATKGTTTVSVVLPALDEEATVGAVVSCVRGLAERTGLVDEVVVMDSGSSDGTRAVAQAAGARVEESALVLADAGTRTGKGEVLWKSLAATSGDIVIFVDADLQSMQPNYVTGLLGPLLLDPDICLVKGFYERPLAGTAEIAGGRVTELMARPLLNLLAPALAGLIQPLSGEYAARRSLLEQLPFASGYGVEVGLLMDTVRTAGLDAIAQVDLGLRRHTHQGHHALGRMASEILQSVLARVAPGLETATALTQFRRSLDGHFEPFTTDVVLRDRPPIANFPGYANRALRKAPPTRATRAGR